MVMAESLSGNCLWPKELHYLRSHGNLGRSGYQKEGVMGREGNLRVPAGFGNVEVMGDFGKRTIRWDEVWVSGA